MPLSTLSKGYEKPSAPSTGDEFFPAMERNIQKMNDHVHDGTTGAINPNATAAIAAGSWVSVAGGNGLYRQEITLPAGRTYDTTDMSFRLSTGEFVYPSIEKTASNKFYVYTNDNSLSYVVIYG